MALPAAGAAIAGAAAAIKRARPKPWRTRSRRRAIKTMEAAKFDLDFKLDDADKPAPMGKARVEPALETATAGAGSGAAPQLTRPAAALELDKLDLSFDPERSTFEDPTPSVLDGQWHDAATKLDLAKAYQEMGDVEGAREILQEVLHEGDDQQKAEAKSLLASSASNTGGGRDPPPVFPTADSDFRSAHALALAVEYAGFAFCGFQSQPSRCGVQDALETRDRRNRRDIRSASTPRDEPTPACTRCRRSCISTPMRRARRAHGCAASTRICPRMPRCCGRIPSPTNSTRASLRAARHYTYLLLCRPERPALGRGSRRLVPSSAGRGRHARRPRRISSARTIFRRFARPSARRSRRSRRSRGSHCARTAPWCSIRILGQRLSAAHGAQHRRRAGLRRRGTQAAGLDRANCWPARDRTRAAPTFAPDGLYFAGADYDARFGLPPTVRAVNGHAR